MFSSVLASLILFCFCFFSVYFGHILLSQKNGTNQLKCNFSDKFAVTSVVKIYAKTWDLWLFVYSINFQTAKLQPQINIFPGNNNLFLLSLALCGSRFLKIKTSVFLVSNPFTFFKVVKIMLSKYAHLMLPGVFQDNVTPVIDCADKAVVQCDVRVVKILL